MDLSKRSSITLTSWSAEKARAVLVAEIDKELDTLVNKYGRTFLELQHSWPRMSH